MRLTRTILGFAAAAAFTLTPVYADSHGHSSAPKPTTVSGKPTTTNGNSTADQTTKTGKPATGKSIAPKSKSATKSASKSKTTTTSATGATSTKSSTTSTTGGSKKKGGTTTTNTTGTTGGSSNTTTTGTTPMNPIASKISAKPNLNAKVTAMLPSGATLNEASKGFKNQGQFIAALHASQRLNCVGPCFTQLKADMVDKHMSLGQSIQDVKHTSSSTASTQAARAEHEADDDLKSTTTATTTTTSSKKDSHKEAEHEERDDHHDSQGEHKDSHKESEHRSVAQQISNNPQLKTRVQALLPAGMTLTEAAKGFRSESQFLAALHASKDLGIPFAQIKGEMTGNDHDSLTRAIEELKPTANAEMAAQAAQKAAAADLKATQPPRTDHDDQ